MDSLWEARRVIPVMLSFSNIEWDYRHKIGPMLGNHNIEVDMEVSETARRLGAQIRQTRINANLSQQQLGDCGEGRKYS